MLAGLWSGKRVFLLAGNSVLAGITFPSRDLRGSWFVTVGSLGPQVNWLALYETQTKVNIFAYYLYIFITWNIQAFSTFNLRI